MESYWTTETCEFYDRFLVVWSYFYNGGYAAAYLLLIAPAFLYFYTLYRKQTTRSVNIGMAATALFVFVCGGGHLFDIFASDYKTPIIFYARAVWQSVGGLISLGIGIGFAYAVFVIKTNRTARTLLKFSLLSFRRDLDTHAADELREIQAKMEHFGERLEQAKVVV